jgi:glycosyltransferase involved in cell wall biosynthesis
VAGFFPPPITGQTMATERLAALLDGSFEVTRVALNAGSDAHVETAPAWRLDKMRRYLGAGRRLRTTVRATPPDVLLWTSVSPQLAGHLRDRLTVAPILSHAARRYGIVHWGNFASLFESPATRWSGQRLMRRLDGFVFLSPSLARSCAPWVPAEKRLAVPNTIDDALCFDGTEVEEKRREKKERGAPLRLLFLSNMIASKGYEDAIEAVDRLRNEGARVELRLAGRWIDDADRVAFETRISGDLAACVTHLGPIEDRGAIRALHRWADVLLFPTYYPTEAQPLVLLEAMSAGTPIVTTAHAGIPDMLESDKEALFVTPRDPGAIASAVRTLAEIDGWIRLSESVRARFLVDFSPEAVRRRWLTLLAATT